MTLDITTQKQYFPQLTGIRALAAYIVFLSHVIPDKDHSKNNFAENISATGYLGVTIFFVLSGFLIAYRYHNSTKFSIGDFKTYMVNRIAKIYPMYFILTVATFVYNHLMHINKLDPIVFITNITFLRGYFDDFLFTGISQGWSLTVEETFYLIAPLLFLFIGKKNAFMYLSGFFILAGLLLVFVFKNINFYQFMGSIDFMFNYTFFGRCIEFFIGISLAVRLQKASSEKRISPISRLNTFTGLFAMIIIILLLVISKDYTYTAFNRWLIVLLNNVAFPVAVYYFLFGLITESTFVKTFFSTKIMVLLGKSSYVFYLIHIGFISYFLSAYFQLHTVTLFIVLNLISILFYYCLENPLNSLIRRLNVRFFKSPALN